MDYADGENFNGTLLRLASVTAFGLVVAGAGAGGAGGASSAGARRTGRGLADIPASA